QGAVGDNALGAVENRAALELGAERLGLEAARLLHNCLATEVVDYNLSVRGLPGIRVAQPAAQAEDRSAQVLNAQSPAADIDHVNIVVAQFAVAGFPEPVPIVVELRSRQRTQRRRSGPQVVVHLRRDLVRAVTAERIAPAVDDRFGELHFAELALPHVLDRGGQRPIRTALRAGLANTAGFARHLYDAPAFA